MKKTSTLKRYSLILNLCLVLITSILSIKATAQSFVEEFDTVASLTSKGWRVINHSAPVGLSTWFQGNSTVFESYSGAFLNSYAGVNYASTGSTGTISNWLLSPTVMLNNGDQIYFYARKTDSAAQNFADRMQVRLSTNDTSINVGTGSAGVGDFTNLLLDINPTLSNIGYPTGFPYSWTGFVITLSGLSGPTSGRFAFRYYVTSAGQTGVNSDYIGLDSVAYVSTITGIQNEEPKIDASIYPNPGNGIFNLQLNPLKPIQGTLEVVNELGQVVYNLPINATSGLNRIRLDLATLPAGVYSIQLKGNYRMFNQKLVIQN